MNYVEALDHPGPSWVAWRTVEAAIFGLPVPDLDLFKALTGRAEPPDRPASEAWIIAGRRSAKSRKAATVATYLSTIGTEVLGYRQRLAPGERGVVLVMAVDKAQAKVTLDYARAYFQAIPMFRAMVERDTGDGLELSNRMALTIVANDYRSIRGRTLVAAILDEVSYWRNEVTANPDLEVYRAVKPALASMPGSLLIGISSPIGGLGCCGESIASTGASRGRCWWSRRRPSGSILGIDRATIADAYEDDPRQPGPSGVPSFGRTWRTSSRAR